MKTENRKDWQADDKQITTNEVTQWNENGVMVTAMMSLKVARLLIRTGRAFVVSDGHIGMCD